jgi:hypothetical protein
MSLTLVIASLVIPVAVLLVDYGRRRLTTMRILRPFIATAIVVPFVMPSFDSGGRGLLLEAAGIGAGVLLGLLAGAAMRVERDSATSAAMTVAGAPYLAIWVAVALARLAFAYEAEHSAGFATALGGFLASNHISSAALADAIMFLGFAMLIVQRGTLVARSYLSVRRPLGADETHAPGAVAAETPS